MKAWSFGQAGTWISLCKLHTFVGIVLTEHARQTGYIEYKYTYYPPCFRRPVLLRSHCHPLASPSRPRGNAVMCCESSPCTMLSAGHPHWFPQACENGLAKEVALLSGRDVIRLPPGQSMCCPSQKPGKSRNTSGHSPATGRVIRMPNRLEERPAILASIFG